MTEFFDLANKLSGVGFGTLLALILYGSFKRVWVWGFELRDAQAEHARQLAEAKAATERWQAMTFAATGLAETSVGIQKSQHP